MSNVKIQGNASGTGTLTIAAPNTNTDRTLTLPDGAGEILTNASSVPAANLTGTLPALDGSNLTGIAGGALEYITTQTITSGDAYVSFTSTYFDSTSYDSYMFRLINCIPATDNTGMAVRVSTDGSTVITATDYAWRSYANSSTGVTSSGNLNTDSYIGLIHTGIGSDTNEYGVCGEVVLLNPHQSSYTYVSSNELTFTGTDGGISCTRHAFGTYRSTTAVNALHFMPQSGNWESGKIAMYGVKKA